MSDKIDPEHYFPEEVVEQILSWLPPVALIRSALVCKMWLTIGQRSEFLKLHRRRSHDNLIGLPRRYIKSPQPRQQGKIEKDRFTVHVDDALLAITEEFFHPFIFSYYCDVVGCSNGVFLITNIDYKIVQLILWNPSIRRYTVIPTKELEQEIDGSQELVLGMYYSTAMDDYRVVLVFYEFFNAPAPLFIRLFSLKSRTWSTYKKPVPRYHLSCTLSQVNVHDALHWFARDTSGPNMIFAFKLHDEVFCGIPLPSDVVNHRVIEPILFNDSLAIYTKNLKNEIQLWALSDYDDTETWTFVLKLRTTDVVLAIAFRLTKEQSVEIFHYSETKEELVCYNCGRKDSRSLDISCCDPPQMGIFTDSMGLYSESKYIVMSNEETHRSGKFIAELVKLGMKVTEALARAGLESSNLIVGIDFAESNERTGGRSYNRRSLHHIGDDLNPYEQAISIIGKTLAAFDENKLIPCYGFGDASTRDQDVFSFYPEDDRHCNGFEEVLNRYREIVPHLRLAGPTSFAPIIDMAMTIVEKSSGQYHVLVIIADGQVTRSVDTERGQLSPQEQKTVDAIVRASNLPLSIVLVGVGDGPWDMMKEFDDNIPARIFDNFQFVNFMEIMSKKLSTSGKETEFALKALMEIPSQYKASIELNMLGSRRGNVPTRVPLPPPVSSASSFRSSKASHSTSFKPSVPSYDAYSSSPYGAYKSPVGNAPPASSSTFDNMVCPICLSNSKDMAFGCGHQTCCECGQDLQTPFVAAQFKQE